MESGHQKVNSEPDMQAGLSLALKAVTANFKYRCELLTLFRYDVLLRAQGFTEYFLSSFILDMCQLSSSTGLKIICLNKINYDFCPPLE